MLIDFDKPIIDLSGKQVQQGGVVATFRSAAENLLLADTDTTGESKLARFKLALKISQATSSVELSIDEMKLLQDHVRLTASTIAVGRFDELLSGK